MIASNIFGPAIVALGFSSSALACVNFKGSTNSDITVTDGDTTTCSDSITTGDKDADCISGYSLNYDWSDNDGTGMPVTYCNPSECWSITIPYDNTESACTEGICGGIYDFDYSTFGC
ncbi:hypothetical protein N7478_008445 [Penicillium angulare]|uniref:uncharacterized protein n=1 Tax=Penicillium angulare TaxID=116970 RepID=UPI00253F997E|nr:uncharacterized protein N7478_008445 [Penicillium angulare]KAJ5273320.1 hypothetical protein N7478_008445 [Penicillium angulare]